MNVWTIFTLPGRLIAWFGYMFPKRGDVWASARRVDNPAVHLLFSLLFYAGVGYVGFAALTADKSPAEARATGETAEFGGEYAAADPADAAPLRSLSEPAPAPDIIPSESLGEIALPAAPTDAGAKSLSEGDTAAKVPDAAPAPTRPFIDVQGLRPATAPALRAELLRLLDSGPSERHGVWRMEGVEGEVMVTPWRRTETGVCRLYSFTARGVEDMAASGYEEACRTGDGPWAID